MPAFTYEAIDHAGKTIRGTLDADSAKTARSQLKGRQLNTVWVKEAPDQSQPQNRFALSARKTPLKKPELAVWTRQLASLVSAGLQIDKALMSLAEETENKAVEALMSDLIGQVISGTSLSNAMRAHPHVFSHVFCSVVAAGESTGNLGSVLESLADDMEASLTLKSKVVGAALYPVIVCAVAGLIVVFLMVYVLPQIAGAFSSSKRSLPLLTTAMLALSSFLTVWWPALLALLAAAGLSWNIAMRNLVTRSKVHALALQLPLVGKLIRNYNAAQFAGTLGMLCTAGIPILSAMEAAANTVSNLAMRSEIDQATEKVREGTPIGLALAQNKTLPTIVSTFARMGTETGAIGPMLSRVGGQLASEVQRRALQVATILEPLLIVVMGLVVMLIVMAVLMPIIEMNTFVQ